MVALAKKAMKSRDPAADAVYAQAQQQQSLGSVGMHHMGMNGMGMPGQMQQQQEVIYAFGEMEDVQGVVRLCLPPGKKFDHLGVKVQFVGRVDMVSLKAQSVEKKILTKNGMS